jgi:integrase/recombinase XerD
MAERGQAAVVNSRQLIDILAELRYPHDRIGRILYLTASRVGEVLPLSSACLRLDRLEIWQPKVQRTKSVPLSDSIKDAIAGLPADGFWFPGRHRGHVTVQAFERELHRVVELLDLDGMGIRTHSFRRSRATHLHNAGLPDRTIMALTGHRSLASFQRYLDPHAGNLAAAMAELDAALM